MEPVDTVIIHGPWPTLWIFFFFLRCLKRKHTHRPNNAKTPAKVSQLLMTEAGRGTDLSPIEYKSLRDRNRILFHGENPHQVKQCGGQHSYWIKNECCYCCVVIVFVSRLKHKEEVPRYTVKYKNTFCKMLCTVWSYLCHLKMYCNIYNCIV